VHRWQRTELLKKYSVKCSKEEPRARVKGSQIHRLNSGSYGKFKKHEKNWSWAGGTLLRVSYLRGCGKWMA
jgi:hypothetical protein